MQTQQNSIQQEGTLAEVVINDEVFYKIPEVDAMRPFFMSIVSDSDHWLFVSSNGGITAGRKNPDYALFPYYTEDKITESAETTGSKTIFRVFVNDRKHTWEPFSIRSEGWYRIRRNIYKSRYGNKILYEEINQDLELSFTYQWSFSNRYGFVRKARLTNHSGSAITIKMLDGLQNILPYGVGCDLQNTTSNLADAYKRAELLPGCGLGIFALSAIIVDKAEPSEALKTNLVWSYGLNNPEYLLSARQLDNFRQGKPITQEEDIKGEKGAYFVFTDFTLGAGQQHSWHIIADVNQSQAAIVRMADHLQNNPDLVQEVEDDVERGTQNLLALTAAADALQVTSDDLADTRHYSNVLFNIMRGGIFVNNYTIEKADFTRYLQKANTGVYQRRKELLESLPASFPVFYLKQIAAELNDPDFIRLATEYLPLKFSRRHGDPSRPWNKFTINTRSETDGSKILDYEGNWRDIFQNWEALAHSYPAFIEGMIFKFLNASTFDGYNPYRVTKDGFDWETIEPDNPWSYIGYWGDHQVIYLLKFLEFAQRHYPQLLPGLLDNKEFVYADVPYIIKPYKDILRNPKDTIAYNHKADKRIQKRKAETGADGALLVTAAQEIHHVSFTEKMLATLLAKLTNLVPGGGIWMNTQRPEWNDANNALVGNGLSMVTLFYLRRFLDFLKPLFSNTGKTGVSLSRETAVYFTEVAAVFQTYAVFLQTDLDNALKKKMLDELGEAAGRYRAQIYTHQFTGDSAPVPISTLQTFLATAQEFLERSISVNKREDGLYHTYNLVSYDDRDLDISHLSVMLEGQVAVLSSGYLSAAESLEVLDALQQSSLYREDQRSYILYPDKSLPSFLQKNQVPAAAVKAIPLLRQLAGDQEQTIVEEDMHGMFHFNGNFTNAGSLETALSKLDTQYQPGVQEDRDAILRLFEQVFNHKEFTGRSGTFFAYEGLGSIYWHMVSKLLLSVQETYLNALQNKAGHVILSRLRKHYYAIKEGIGVHKKPALYGAFPTDPYSHTPLHKGAQQPGMTGQVKEDIISRFGELGISIEKGIVVFKPSLLRKDEFLQTGKETGCLTVSGEMLRVQVPPNSLLFTCCQVPVIYTLDTREGMRIRYKNGREEEKSTTALSAEEAALLFNRGGDIQSISVYINPSFLEE